MITKRFKEMIKKLDIDYKIFAQKTNIDYNKVRQIAIGKQKITAKIVLLCEYYFDINPLWLMYGIGEIKEAKFNLKQKEIWSDKQNFEKILEDKLQFRYKILEENSKLQSEIQIKSDNYILCKLLDEVACDEFKKGLKEQLEMIKELKDG